jgi:hypothetical protein
MPIISKTIGYDSRRLRPRGKLPLGELSVMIRSGVSQ